MIRKYATGIIALVIAVVTFSFTRPAVDMYVFEFKPTQPYSVNNVENESNTFWEYKGKNIALCSGDNEKACKVAVTSSYVNSTTSPTALSGVTITATLSGATAHVTNITANGTNTISNKLD